MNALMPYAAAAGVVLLAGCAAYSGYGLKPGVAKADEVRRTMGAPERICEGADGGQIWIYPRGPAGYATFNARLDRNGVLLGIENVLDERGFARVQAGKSTKQDILCLFGSPYYETYFKSRRELVWDYRFKDAWGYPARFHVLFNDAGIVTSTMQLREHYPDFILD